MSDSREGEVLAGKYRLEKRLGSGGMGEVYRAENIQIGRTVAIKLLHPEGATEPTTVQRFLREAKAANKVKHPNVVDVLDVGEDAKGVPFIVQEFLHGHDLAQHFGDMGGRISPQTALAILLPVVEAVACAHRSGVVHRDLKLENVFLARVGDKMVPKVLDFGISRIKDEPFEARLTGTQVAMGTPLYMSPEQIRGLRHVDTRSDVWSIGVMLFELMAGEPPFMGESQGDLFLSISTEKPKALPASVDTVLGAIIWRCLQKEQANRYQDAGEIAKDLKAFLDDRNNLELELSTRLGGVMALERGIGLRRANTTGPTVAKDSERPKVEADPVRDAPTAEEKALTRPEPQRETELAATKIEVASKSEKSNVPTASAAAPVPSTQAKDNIRKSSPSQKEMAAIGASVPQMPELEPSRPSRISSSSMPAVTPPPKGVGLKPVIETVPVAQPVAPKTKIKFREAQEVDKHEGGSGGGAIAFALAGFVAIFLCLAIFATPIWPLLRERFLATTTGVVDVFAAAALVGTLVMSRVGAGVNYRYIDWDLLIGAFASAGLSFSLFCLAHPVLAAIVGQRTPYAVFDKLFPWCLAVTFIALAIYGIRSGIERLQRDGATLVAGVIFALSFALAATSIRATIDAVKASHPATVETNSGTNGSNIDDEFAPEPEQHPTVHPARDAGTASPAVVAPRTRTPRHR